MFQFHPRLQYVGAGGGAVPLPMAGKYPGKEWENQLGSFDMTLYMGCNDMTSAEYFAKKCGKVTISVTNNQFPLAPLFSPIYSTTRPYSQTRSNTQRDLLQPDEFLRLNKFLCIVMFNHYKPAQLYKIMLEELPEYKKLKNAASLTMCRNGKERRRGCKASHGRKSHIGRCKEHIVCSARIAAVACIGEAA